MSWYSQYLDQFKYHVIDQENQKKHDVIIL